MRLIRGGGENHGVRAFADTRDPDDAEWLAAPVHWPRPSRLEEPLSVPGQKAAEAAESLGLLTMCDLPPHLPRDRQAARTVAALSPGETARVVVEVRSIRSRPFRRRGMKPL